MTANKIYHGLGGVATTATGYLDFPGTTGNAAIYTRPLLTTLDTLEFVVHLRADVLGVTQSFCGWAGAYASFLFNTTNALQMYFRGTATRAVGNAASPTAIPGWTAGTWTWLRGRVTRTTANCEYWYSFESGYPASWISLGAAVGTYAGELLIATAHDNVYIGQRGSTTFLDGQIDYFAEWDDGVKAIEVDLREADVLPPNVSLVTGTPAAAFIPRGTAAPSKIVQDLYIGRKRYYPVANGYFRHNPGVGAYSNAMFAANSPTFAPDDLDVRWFGRLTNWAQAAGTAMFSLWETGTNQRSWLIESGSGQSRLSFSTTGVNQFTSTLITMPFASGQVGGIRFTRRKSDGIITQWFSYDGVSWIPQASTTVAGAGSAPWPATTSLIVGGYSGGVFSPIKGDTYYAEVRNGIDGPVVFRVGPETFRRLDNNAATFPAESGQTITRQGSVGSPPWIYPTVKPEDTVDLHNAGTQVWPATPTNSNQKAKWGVSQYNDGTKVA